MVTPWWHLHPSHPWRTDPNALKQEAIWYQRCAADWRRIDSVYATIAERRPIVAQELAAIDYEKARYFTGLWLEASR